MTLIVGRCLHITMQPRDVSDRVAWHTSMAILAQVLAASIAGSSRKENKAAERFFLSYQPLTFKSIKLGLAGVAIPQYLSKHRLSVPYCEIDTEEDQQ